MEPPVDSTLYSDLILFIISLIFCAIFSFLETSITAIRLFKLKEMAQSTKKYKNLFKTLEDNPNRVLITILVAYNLANVIAAVFSSKLMETLSKALNLSENIGFILGILITSTTILIADLIPKNIATQKGEALFKSSLWMTNILYYGLHPFVTFLSRFTDAATKIITRYQDVEISETVTTEKEVKFLIDYINEKGLMERQKIGMLQSIFGLSTTTVKEVMVPETEIISINANSTQQQTLDIFTKYQFTRLPVYEDETDNVIGMLHQKDFFQLLSKKEEKPLSEIVRPIMFIPESARVLGLLKEFREQRMHIAIVLNEFGGITGLVTLEDLIEEIVGEISDEYEAVPEKIVSLKSGGWLIDASIDLEELSSLLEIEFETEDALTLGGFLTEYLQHLPKKGEELEYKNYYFQVQQASPKKVFQVLVYKNEDQRTNETSSN